MFGSFHKIGQIDISVFKFKKIILIEHLLYKAGYYLYQRLFYIRIFRVFLSLRKILPGFSNVAILGSVNRKNYTMHLSALKKNNSDFR